MLILKGILANWKWVLGVAVLMFALKFGYDAYSDYQDMISRQIRDAETIGKLESVNAANEATIAAAEEQNRIIQNNMNELQTELSDSKNRVRELQGILSRHNLEYLALQRPGLIERRINDGTKEVFDNLSCVTDPNCLR